MFAARCSTFDLLEEDEAAHEGAGVARGVTNHHPAHGVLNLTEGLHMGFGFPRVLPQKFPVKGTVGVAEFEANRQHFGAAFEHVELRPDDEGVRRFARPARLARQLGG